MPASTIAPPDIVIFADASLTVSAKDLSSYSKLLLDLTTKLYVPLDTELGVPDNTPLLLKVIDAGILPDCNECVTVCNCSDAAFLNVADKSKVPLVSSFSGAREPPAVVHVIV